MRYFTLTIYIIYLLAISCSDQGSLSRNVESVADRQFKVDTTIANRGKHVTSKGELKVLFIFSQFSDDTTASKSWKFKNGDLPNWGGNIINSSNIPNFQSNNLSQYFYEMSFGNLMIYGDVYPKLVIPKYSQDKYKSIAEVNYEILSNLDDEIDYSQYDNWSKGDNYEFVKEKDGRVDMIFILYRNFEDRLFFDKKWTGAAHLYLTEDINTNDGVKISTGRLDRGSGIQSRRGKSGFEYIKYVLAHEFGHFLFGAGHIENVTNLALMTGGPVWNASRGMHSWEREKLDWIDYIDIPTDKNSAIIAKDYITNGEAYRIKLSDSEWYVIENHQKISDNDWAQDKGIYIYHIKNPKHFPPKVTVKCADGNWDFKVDKINEQLIRVRPNPLGKSEMNILLPTREIRYACYEQVYTDNSAWGDKFDAFDTNYNNVISPVSNPSTQNSANINFALHIKEQQSENYIVNIFFDEIYKNTPPSRPQIEDIKANENGEVTITWLRNSEPDLAGYILSTYIMNNGRLEPFESIDVEKNERSISLSDKLFPEEKSYALALTSVDKMGNESLESDLIELIYNSASEKWEWETKESY